MTGPFAGAPPQVGRATARTSVFAEQKPWRRHGFAVSSILIAQRAPGVFVYKPLGTGAGYAGGIVSAAVDGIRGAEAIAKG